MSDIAIRVEGLGKLYRIGRREKYYTVRDTLANAFMAPFQWLSNGRQPTADDSLSPSIPNSQSAIRNSPFIWALKDVSFEVKQGEVVGIIGRNGAGKSTLLKILSRITKPTEGYAEIHGRVGSLLEVGTGFHPELTGRENIYLNGAILGMKRAEINRKFDEIVAFAEVEKFLDTPVKHYSSGMYMRLAFSVAAHLEPEILLVDEVLAVGDASFQKKCLEKMGDVAKGGRTVLFVSHNMGAISQLCERCIWLHDGRVEKIGSTESIIHAYLASTASPTGAWTNSLLDETEPDIKLIKASIVSIEGIQSPVVRYDQGFNLEICYEVEAITRSPWTLVFRVSNASGMVVFTSWDVDSINPGKPEEIGRYCATCHVPGRFLRPGPYSVSLGIYFTNSHMTESDFREHLFHFEVSSAGFAMNADRGGIITPVLGWSIERVSN